MFRLLPFSLGNIAYSLQYIPVDNSNKKDFFSINSLFCHAISQEWKIATTKKTFEANEEENLNFNFGFFLCF
jgi:hypothetical protein